MARITEAARDVFLTRGYAGTTIDEIARSADVSRASFYTYFPSKRAVLLAVGANAATECEKMIQRLRDHGPTRAAMREWVADYFDFLDVHGSFAFAWTQAAHEDDEIRVAGMKRHLGLCKRLGQSLMIGARRKPVDPAPLGIIAFSVLERGWNYGDLYADVIDRDALIEQTTNALWGAVRQSPTA